MLILSLGRISRKVGEEGKECGILDCLYCAVTSCPTLAIGQDAYWLSSTRAEIWGPKPSGSQVLLCHKCHRNAFPLQTTLLFHLPCSNIVAESFLESKEKKTNTMDPAL